MDVQKTLISHAPWLDHTMTGTGREYLLMALFLAATTVFLHGTALQGAWRWDDGMHLLFAAKYSPYEYFFVPKITLMQSGVHVTPWNAFFYDTNLAFFGMDPKGHYAHMLALLALGATLFYAVLRHWLPWLSALIGALAFLLGKPTVHIAQGLMHGHYAAGWVFALVALLGWCRFFKTGRTVWLGLATLAYLLATTCKEIYVPLVVVLPFLPVGKWRQRLVALLPFLLVAVLYVGWRYAVLGAFLGGYSPGGIGFDATNTAQQILAIPPLLTGTRAAGLIELTIFTVLFGWAVWQVRINWLLLTVLLGVVLTPLVPLTIFPGVASPDRYLFVPWALLAISLAVAWPRQEGALISLLLGLVLFITMGVEHRREERKVLKDVGYHQTLYGFALTLDSEKQGVYVGRDDSGYKVPLFNSMFAARYHLPVESENKHGDPIVLTDLDLAKLKDPAELRSRLNGRQLFRYFDGDMRVMENDELLSIGKSMREGAR